jgi:hypothetical protein
MSYNEQYVERAYIQGRHDGFQELADFLRDHLARDVSFNAVTREVLKDLEHNLREKIKTEAQ